MPFESPPPYVIDAIPQEKGFNRNPPLKSFDTTRDEPLQRCSYCKQLYKESDNRNPSTTCFYHPGDFYEKNIPKQRIFIGWNCCKAVSKNSRGCKILSTLLFSYFFYKFILIFHFRTTHSR